MTRTVTFAHLTDVHLAPLVGFGVRHANVKRVLGYLNWHRGRKRVHLPDVIEAIAGDIARRNPDHIAVTGDLVNLGLPAEYERATRWLERLGAPDAVSVVPGNHDIYTKLRADPGVGRWRAYMTSDDWGRQRMAGITADNGFPYVRRIGPVALIGLNSAHPTPPFVAAGRVGGVQLAALARLLSALKADGLARVVLIHHPPLGSQAPRLRALADAATLEQTLMAHGAELVLHGHNHRIIIEPRAVDGGTMLVLGLTSASAGRAHHGEGLACYNMLRIDCGENVVRVRTETRGLDAENGEVVALGRREWTLQG